MEKNELIPLMGIKPTLPRIYNGLENPMTSMDAEMCKVILRGYRGSHISMISVTGQSVEGSKGIHHHKKNLN